MKYTVGMTVLLFAVLFFTAVGSAQEPAQKQLDFFETKIRPVLVEHCYECHSTQALTAKKLKGGLLLDSRGGGLKGGETGPAVVPGKPDKSLLISALRQEDFEMPPNGKLPDSVIADFVQWVEMGAPDPRDGSDPAGASAVDIEAGREHWSFQPLQSLKPPAAQDATWVRTPIDQFIRVRQETTGIVPNAVADAHTLVRRAYYDLVGLPPSLDQVEEFVKAAAGDFTAAYAKLVDGLLENEQYGERWGRHWLDVVRFAESNGYAFDLDRPNAWRYRDFVIRALNADMPYDEFVRRQLAGDLLTNVDVQTSDEAKVAIEYVAATGFLVAGPFTSQQTQKERERSRYEQLDDVVNTLGTSMLALTVGCCRCHDHKFDPLPQHDYYRFASCFSEIGSSNTGINEKPEAFRSLKAEFDAAHAPLVAARTKFEQESLSERFEAWLPKRKDSSSAEPFTLSFWRHIGPFKAADYNQAYDGVFPPEVDTDLAKTYEDGKLTWTEQLDWRDGEAHNDKFKDVNAAHYLLRMIETKEPRVLSLSLGSDDGIKVWVNGRRVLESKKVRNGAAADQNTVVVQLTAGRNELLMKIANSGDASGFYFQAKAGEPPEEIVTLLGGEPAEWTAEQQQKVTDWYKGFDPEWLRLNQVVVRHSTEEPKPELTRVFAARVRGTTYQFGDDTYKVYHLRRGNANNKEGEAEPGFFQVLMRTDRQEKHWITATDDAQKSTQESTQESAQEPAKQPARLALADWLSDTDKGAGHLLARVIVNRLWHHHFGRGIVATPSDFGTRGEKPSHPELLEWLAGELIRGGWRIKPIHKLIMTSAVYTQAGEITESGRRHDPENLLLWRRNSRRLEAEVIRDAMLAISGTLDRTQYGKGTLDLASKRRSIYFTVKRGQLIPLLQLFDAPDAMQGIGDREESTVAPQALALLNSPIVRELAVRFAERIRQDPETVIEGAVERAWRTALSRAPNEAERESIKAFIQVQIKARASDENALTASLDDFCHLLLCMNEFVYVD